MWQSALLRLQPKTWPQKAPARDRSSVARRTGRVVAPNARPDDRQRVRHHSERRSRCAVVCLNRRFSAVGPARTSVADLHTGDIGSGQSQSSSAGEQQWGGRVPIPFACGQIGSALIVGRTTRQPGRVSTVSFTYLLQRSGQIGGHDVSWITYIALLTLLVGGEWRSGSTPGKRLFGMRVVAAESPERLSGPLKRIAIRYGIAIAGVLLPLGLALAVTLVPVMEGKEPSSFPVFALLLALSSAWQIWNAVRIARRRTTIYDHIAGVEVIRVPRPQVEGPAFEPPAPV